MSLKPTSWLSRWATQCLSTSSVSVLSSTRGYWQFFDWLVKSGKKAFADIKVYDIPETVEASVRKLVGRGASFVTVHAHDKMIRAAVKGRAEHTDLKILAVTVLTSLDSGDLQGMGFPDDNVSGSFWTARSGCFSGL